MEPVFISAGNPANVLTKQDAINLLNLVDLAPITGKDAMIVAQLKQKLLVALQQQETAQGDTD